MASSNLHEPEGEIVSTTPSIAPDVTSPLMHLTGTHISLRPLQVSDTPLLWHSLSNPSLWTYLPEGPFTSYADFEKHIISMCSLTFFFPFVLLSKNPAHCPENLEATFSESSSKEGFEGLPVGITTLMTIRPTHRSIEIGHVLYSSLLQRTPASTEASFLLLKLCFDQLHYDRVEWKCNDLNKPSMKAATRLGFSYEGTFRRHLVVKGRRRDTAWFSVVREEWGAVGRCLEVWLGEENFEGGGQKERVEEVRERLAKEGE